MSTPLVLADAEAMVSMSSERTSGLWPRAGAMLARQALEDAIEERYRRTVPGLERASARVKLICLRTYAGESVAHEATQLWGELSRACHVHAYELSPTGAELDAWIDRVEQVVRALR